MAYGRLFGQVASKQKAIEYDIKHTEQAGTMHIEELSQNWTSRNNAKKWRASDTQKVSKSLSIDFSIIDDCCN